MSCRFRFSKSSSFPLFGWNVNFSYFSFTNCSLMCDGSLKTGHFLCFPIETGLTVVLVYEILWFPRRAHAPKSCSCLICKNTSIFLVSCFSSLTNWEREQDECAPHPMHFCADVADSSPMGLQRVYYLSILTAARARAHRNNATKRIVESWRNCTRW